MIDIAYKNIRILLIGISSGYIFYYMEFSERVNDTLDLLVKSNSSKAFGLYILINIGKFAALIFSILALIIFLKVIINKEID